MEKFNILIELFTLFEVEFNRISPTEIILCCPCDKVTHYSKALLPTLELVNDPTVGCVTDEIFIHIMYDSENDSLDWLVVDFDEYD